MTDLNIRYLDVLNQSSITVKSFYSFFIDSSLIFKVKSNGSRVNIINPALDQ
jgi:hypothetical protein